MTREGLSVYNIPMEKEASPRRPQPSASTKMMDYLARRDHSEKELRKKLKTRFTPEEIDKAIEYGKANGWIPDTPEGLQNLAEKTAAALRRRGKGTMYINQYLKEKGLPPVKPDVVEELEKARELVKNKFSNVSEMDRKEKAKVGRFLMSRGFNLDIVRKVIYESEDV